MILETVAVLSAGVFAGAAIYITLVEHPARLECGTLVAVREFGPSYRRAAIMQASLAIIGLLAGIAVWIRTHDSLWLTAALLLGLVVPLTLLVIAPTNRRLLDPSLIAESAEAAELLSRWGKLHAMRSILGIVSFVGFVWAFGGQPPL